MADKQAGGGCKKIALIGCGVGAVLLAGLVVLVMLNLDKVKEIVGEVGDLMALRNEIVAAYDADEVSVSVKAGSGSAGNTLIIKLVNADFGEEEPDLHAKAREIAAFAKAKHPSPDDYGQVEIKFGSKTGPVVVDQHYTFDMKDL